MSDSPQNILARLEELRQWQEEQQEILIQKQIAQREILSKEQQKMYQLFGLNVNKGTLTEQCQTLDKSTALSKEYESVFDDDDDDDAGNGNAAKKDTPNENQQDQYEIPQAFSLNTDSDDSDAVGDENKISKEQSKTDLLEAPTNKPKRAFLKRGQGLTTRFKVNPDNFKLDRLPKYKFANTHKKKNFTNKKLTPEPVEDIPIPVPIKVKSKIKEPHNLSLKCPEHKELKKSQSSVADNIKSHDDTDDLIAQFLKSNSDLLDNVTKGASSMIHKVKSAQKVEKAKPAISWSKVLDPKNIEPVQIGRSSYDELNSPAKKQVMKQQKELDDLNIFELLEQKVDNSSFNGNTSSILRILDGKGNAKDSLIDDDVAIISDTKKIELKPHPFDERRKYLIDETTTDDDVDDNDSNDVEESHHVRFVDKVIVNEIYDNANYDDDDEYEDIEENASETDTILSKEMNELDSNQISTPNIKKRSSSENHKKRDEDEDTTLCNSEASKDLAEKSELLKTRLTELEKEIESFRTLNSLLTKMRNNIELEKLQLAQEREELSEKLNDDRIQMEVYLHDERIKIEDAKIKYDKLFKELQKPNRKDREEVVKFKAKNAELEASLKAKEIRHGAAQARLRSQIKTLEKENKEQQLEIEVLAKENKKLEAENSRLRRQHNNKILHEINNNIAKLAPQILEVNKTNDGKQAVSTTKKPSVTCNVTKSKSVPNLCTDKGDKDNLQESSDESGYDPSTVTVGYFGGRNKQSKSLSPTEKSSREKKQRKASKTIFLSDSEDEAPEASSSKENDPKTAKKSHLREEDLNSKREILNADGSRDYWYKNGNIKKISPDGLVIRMLYFNKDIKESNLGEGTIKYYYAETNTWHTSYLDGLEILEFPNGQTEHRYKDGTVEIHYPNGSIRTMNPNKKDIVEEWKYNDGTNVCLHKNGEKVLTLANGQREIHTKLHKRREYPDGTVKILYPDGSQETRYSNGRVRLKDKEGNLISDSDGNVHSSAPSQRNFISRSR